MTDHPEPPDSANKPDQWDAVARFLAGEGSAGDDADVRQWLIAHPDDARVVASLDALLPPVVHDMHTVRTASAGTLPFGRPIDVEGALRSVHARMETVEQRPVLSNAAPSDVRRLQSGAKAARTVPAASPYRPWRTALWAAAALVVTAVGVTQWRTKLMPAATVALTYETPVGGSDSVTLSDGSTVILGAGSRLIVAGNYGQGQRDVELQGAGQFTVVHDEARPFSVRVGSALVRDLGTVFTVKSVGRGVVVAVTEGAVRLSDSATAKIGQGVSLNAGDLGRMLADGSVVSERGSVTPNEAAWVDGKLIYRDAPLADMQADLRRWYGVELVVSDSVVRTQSVTTDFLTSEPVSLMMKKLELLWDASASRSGDTVFIDKSGNRPKR